MHDYGITLELLPDAAQKQALAQQIGNARFVRNHYLSDPEELLQGHQENPLGE